MRRSSRLDPRRDKMKSRLGSMRGRSPNTAAAGEETSVAASLHRRWFYLLPAIFVTYSLAYVDRANFGFGVAAGLGATLHISGKDSSLLAGLFFLGYFAFQICLL